jgi:hypothetical protein
MDPVTIGLAAAALIAVKFAEAGASEAGKSAWKAISSLRMAVANKLKKPALLAVTSSPESDSVDVPKLATEIAEAAEDDSAFRIELERLIREVQKDPAGNTLLAQAQDHAKQANVAGSNFGNITFS